MQGFIQVHVYFVGEEQSIICAPWGMLPEESFEIYASEVASGGFCGPRRLVTDVCMLIGLKS